MEQSDIGALFAVPMRWGTINLGVLDLYRKAPGPLSDTQLRDVMRAADLAALMILWVRTDPGDGERLDYSLHGRAKIHQAASIMLTGLRPSPTRHAVVGQGVGGSGRAVDGALLGP